MLGLILKPLVREDPDTGRIVRNFDKFPSNGNETCSQCYSLTITVFEYPFSLLTFVLGLCVV